MSTNEAAPEAAVDVSGSELSGVDVSSLDLSHAVWRKSSYSGGNGSCVEVADLGEHFAVRDSKDRDGPKLMLTADDWRAFLANLKAGVDGL